MLVIWAAALLVVSSNAQFSPSDSTRADQSQQTTAPATTTQTPPATGQVKTNTEDLTVIPLRSRADLIPIRVVVRDRQGSPVANLHKEDFRVFEDRKPQDISYFSVETPKTLSLMPETADSAGGKTIDPGVQKKEPGEPTASSHPPAHFVALLFDDVHIAVEDLSRTRDAAIRFVEDSLSPTDRVAVLTISGQSELDFTANREMLHTALLGLRQRTMGDATTPGTRECPSIDYYQADRIVNQHDQEATNVAVYEALACAFGDDPVALSEARTLAMSAAQRVNDAGEMQTRESFRRLEEVVQSISSRPGQRSLVLLSPGFICPSNQYELADIIDRANRMNIFINTLDARGLYTSDLGDAGLAKVDSQCRLVSSCNGGWIASRARVRTAGQSAQSQVLDALAEGTGGLDSHNNDLAGALLRLASLPEVSYLIAFTPHNLKYDGKFHSLKVKLDTNEHVTIQARRGFYDPKQN
jgi:VWFA-related protein